MHEYGMCADIISAVRRRAAGRRIERVKVRVGVMHRIVEEAFRDAFTHAAAGSEAEGAAVEVEAVPITVRCGNCGAHAAAAELVIACASCGAMDLDFSGGDELVLESIHYAPAPEE